MFQSCIMKEYKCCILDASISVWAHKLSAQKNMIKIISYLAKPSTAFCLQMRLSPNFTRNAKQIEANKFTFDPPEIIRKPKVFSRLAAE